MSLAIETISFYARSLSLPPPLSFFWHVSCTTRRKLYLPIVTAIAPMKRRVQSLRSFGVNCDRISLSPRFSFLPSFSVYIPIIMAIWYANISTKLMMSQLNPMTSMAWPARRNGAHANTCWGWKCELETACDFPSVSNARADADAWTVDTSKYSVNWWMIEKKLAILSAVETKTFIDAI